MSDRPIRKTEIHIVERGRRRAHQQRGNDLPRRLPILIAVIIALLAVGYSIFTRAYQPPRAANAGVTGPRMQVDSEQIDLGRRTFNQPARAVFTIKNVGDDTLNLSVPRVVTALKGC
jgi:hypothetical protein